MKDKEQNQHETVHLPPIWCSGICRNAMNEICIEHCAIKRDCSAFEPLKDLKFADLPRFPKTTEMTREEKFTSVTIYLAKIVDHLQGNEDDHIHLPLQKSERSSNNHGRSQVAATVKNIAGLHIDSQNSAADSDERQPIQIGQLLSSSFKEISAQEDK